MKPPIKKRNFLKDGKWITNPQETKILLCVCGEKYLKTRPGQTMCVRCMYKPKTLV